MDFKYEWRFYNSIMTESSVQSSNSEKKNEEFPICFVVILRKYCTSTHWSRWFFTILFWSFHACLTHRSYNVLSAFHKQFAPQPGHVNSHTTKDWLIIGVLSLLLQKNSILQISYEILNTTGWSFLWFTLILRMEDFKSGYIRVLQKIILTIYLAKSF